MVLPVDGAREKFDGHPGGSRAIQLWDSEGEPLFPQAFGRPSG